MPPPLNINTILQFQFINPRLEIHSISYVQCVCVIDKMINTHIAWLPANSKGHKDALILLKSASIWLLERIIDKTKVDINYEF